MMLDNREIIGEENPREDEEGLKLDGYDLVLLGTGLTMSIISAAAVKAGLTVLHVDRNDFYGGEQYNSHNSLSSFISHLTDPTNTVQNQSIPLDLYVHPFLQDAKSKIKYKDDSQTSHPAVFGYLMEKCSPAVSLSSNFHPCFMGYSRTSSTPLRHILKGDREFNLEGCSKLLLCDESTIDLLIRSGISEYVDFRCLQSLHCLTRAGELLRVPCSKADVFSSTFLSALEKRALMRLQSFTADWTVQQQQQQQQEQLDQVALANERALGGGGALVRPQNKAPDGKLSAALQSSRNFSTFLQSHCQLSAPLVDIVIHALCMRSEPAGEGDATGDDAATSYSPTEGMADLAQHFSALGRYVAEDGSSPSAFLVPVFGTADVLQAFCRVSAVWGGIFILRRSVEQVRVTSEDGQEQELPLRSLLGQGDRAFLGQGKVCGVRDSGGKFIRCKQLIVESSHLDLSGLRHIRWVLRAVLVCQANAPYPLPLPLSAPGLLVLPPRSPSLDNWAAVQVLQFDSTTRAAPEGQGVAVLHIRSVLRAGEGFEDALGLLERTLALLQRSDAIARTRTGDDGSSGHRRFQVLLRHVQLDRTAVESEEDALTSSLPEGVRWVQESDDCIHLQHSLKKARGIFHSLFPTLPFFAPKKQQQQGEDAETGTGSGVLGGASEGGGDDEETRFFQEALRALAPVPVQQKPVS